MAHEIKKLFLAISSFLTLLYDITFAHNCTLLLLHALDFLSDFVSMLAVLENWVSLRFLNLKGLLQEALLTASQEVVEQHPNKS